MLTFGNVDFCPSETIGLYLHRSYLSNTNLRQTKSLTPNHFKSLQNPNKSHEMISNVIKMSLAILLGATNLLQTNPLQINPPQLQ